MKKSQYQRTTVFRWNTRFELYNYFKTKFNMESYQVDETISRAMADFKPRQGQVIKTQELWQKVGLMLEYSHSDRFKPSIS
ncbi:MAG: hypothetical protein GX640_19875 [Fibrobacter sp.]|nr:hypothetical protein [Fibrobacter sp.]